MTPTLAGRLQTRIVLLATIGVLATLIITPFLPRPEGATLSDVYEVTFGVLLSVAVVGLGWELVYHGIQQFRWEKDWPTICVLVTGINEGALLWFLLRQDVLPWIASAKRPEFDAFIIHFAFVWICVWLFVIGPIRAVVLRWRFRGGEFT